jgi:leucyl-tRNA synthetase
MVIGTILEDKAPFKNVIVNGLVLAGDGKKMSKRLKNYPDPTEVVDKYGSDALRYYLIMSGASMASELRFKNDEVKEVLQTVIIPLTNSLAFFEEYYTLYNKKKIFDDVVSDLPFDKWILKRTYDFIAKILDLDITKETDLEIVAANGLLTLTRVAMPTNEVATEVEEETYISAPAVEEVATEAEESFDLVGEIEATVEESTESSEEDVW